MRTALEAEPSCPGCNQNDRVAHAAGLYLAGLEKKYPGKIKPGQTANLQAPCSGTADFSDWEELKGSKLIALAVQLAPPAHPKKAASRLIHPDLVIGAFSLIAPVFIYGTMTSEPGMMVYTFPLLAGLYFFYFWQRKGLISKYKNQIQAQRIAEERIRRGIERWMWLRCCARCEVVFLPGKDAVDIARTNEVLLF